MRHRPTLQVILLIPAGNLPLHPLPQDSRPQWQHQRHSPHRQGPSLLRIPKLFLLTTPQFKQLSGTDRTYSRQGDSGKQVKYHNCSTCNTIMWVEAEAMQGMMIVKTGTIDDEDALNKAVPVQEIYCVHRPESFGEYPGIAHKEKS